MKLYSLFAGSGSYNLLLNRRMVRRIKIILNTKLFVDIAHCVNYLPKRYNKQSHNRNHQNPKQPPRHNGVTEVEHIFKAFSHMSSTAKILLIMIRNLRYFVLIALDKNLHQ